MGKTKKTKEEKLGCLWEVVGYLILFGSLVWVISNKEKIGTFGILAFIVVAMIAISALKVKGRGSRGSAETKEQPKTPPQAKSKFSGVSQPPKLPDYAEKTSEGEELIVSCLPAYDPAKDHRLTKSTGRYFSDAEKELLKGVIKIIVAKDAFFMANEEGKRVYEIRYEAIDKIMHRERAKPVFIYALNKESYSDRIPFPTWSSKFDRDILEAIAERANLEEKITKQEFRGTTIESSYYGRKT